ncbi:MAG: alpha/beta hydrolase, partial [Gammaproteobacteria bacterium]
MTKRILRRAACLSLAAATLVLGGCVGAGTVSHLITTPPNDGHPKPYPGFTGKIARTIYTQQLKVTVGPPSATLSAAIIAPRNYGFSTSDRRGWTAEQRITKWRFGNASPKAVKHDHPSDSEFLTRLRRSMRHLPYCTPVGTVIVLPGWGIAKELRLGSALDFANHGYRVVLVDLRGQGDSSGKFVSFGLIEHEDIIQLITALEARGLIIGKLALFGISEGAVIALDTAADDPRVNSVIAVAPFTSFATAVRGIGTDFVPTLSLLINHRKLDQALQLANTRTGLNLTEADPLPRVSRIQAPVLYISGSADDIAPPAGVKALAAATPHAHYIELARYTHLA